VRLFVSAGDTSGDLHGGAVVERLRQQFANLQVDAFGGAALERAGARVLEPLAADPVMGFGRVLGSIGYFLGVLSAADRSFRANPPDLLLCIDYPGFNVNLAHLAHRCGIPTCYYICPQYWGWAPWRARRFARAVDKALVIFPFEEAFFGSLGIQVQYVGHPVADRVAAAASALPTERPDIALLPGSRRLEIERHLPWMLESAELLQRQHTERLSFSTTHPDPTRRAQIEAQATATGVPLRVQDCSLPDLLARSRLALVSSGTATLECALLGVPSLVLYKVTPFLRQASRAFLTSPFIAQPNLLAGHEVFPEFLTSRNPAGEMARRAATLLGPSPARSRCLRELETLRERFLRPGADQRAADQVAHLLDRGAGSGSSPRP
jgi:lipid-A-disaccharide synthase